MFKVFCSDTLSYAPSTVNPSRCRWLCNQSPGRSSQVAHLAGGSNPGRAQRSWHLPATEHKPAASPWRSQPQRARLLGWDPGHACSGIRQHAPVLFWLPSKCPQNDRGQRHQTQLPDCLGQPSNQLGQVGAQASCWALTRLQAGCLTHACTSADLADPFQSCNPAWWAWSLPPPGPVLHRFAQAVLSSARLAGMCKQLPVTTEKCVQRGARPAADGPQLGATRKQGRGEGQQSAAGLPCGRRSRRAGWHRVTA